MNTKILVKRSNIQMNSSKTNKGDTKISIIPIESSFYLLV